MELGLGNQPVLFTGWPVRASEARPGETDRGAGDHDCGQQDERHPADTAVGVGGEPAGGGLRVRGVGRHAPEATSGRGGYEQD